MANAEKVLVIEDDEDLRESLNILFSENYQVLTAKDGIEGVEIAQQQHPSVIVLDVMMPRRDGYRTLSMLKDDPATKKIPIVMLTAASDLPQRLKAFQLGVDDFVSKPCEPQELLERVASKVRFIQSVFPKTPKSKKDPKIHCGNLTMDSASLEVWIGEKPVQLSFLEFNLVKYLIKHKNKLRTRRQILDAVWKSKEPNDRLLDPHIMLIRRKLSGFDHEISSIYGGGYILRQIKEPPRLD